MNATSQKTIRLAAILGAVTVAFGAFGAHGLKPHLDVYQTGIFEKGIQYQFYHVLALAVLGLLQTNQDANPWLGYSKWLFTAGIAFFSGSLYLLACKDILPFGVSWAGPVTPLGGLCFIAGWAGLAVSTLRT